MVDDEPITMEVVQTFLEEFGYSNFVQIDDSRTAMDTLEQHSPDVLLLDLIMPGKSGLELLAEIRNHRRYKHLPIVVLTASSNAEDKLQALELGATDFLAKPVDQSELGLRIRNTLAAKAYLDQLAYYDTLTKLPNKQMFENHFEWALKKAKRYGENLALLIIDMDNFSRINATIGVSASDDVLVELAARLKNAVRDIDMLAATIDNQKVNHGLFRLDGNTFTLLLDHPKAAESAALVAERLLKTISTPIKTNETELIVTASIGLATYPLEGSDCATLRQLASSAKEYSKNKGGDCFHFSSKEINAIYEKRLQMETRLRRALAKDELVLFYQPKINVQSGELQGVEALIRWQSKDLGMIPPTDFIPLAEETKLILPIGEWVLLEACRTQVQWHNMGIKPVVISVNLSVTQLEDPALLETVRRAFVTTGADPGYIKMEITESLLLSDVDQKIEFLYALRALGVRLSIDDFGTGYSSLSYLAKLPVDELKIDRSFITDVATSKESRAIVSSIVYLAHSLKLCTVAEGIETKQQLDFILEQGCDEYQGYYFSRPLPAEEIIEFLPT